MKSDSRVEDSLVPIKDILMGFGLEWVALMVKDKSSVIEGNQIADKYAARINQLIQEARIDELKELQMAKDITDDVKDYMYKLYLKDRLKQLSAPTQGD